MVYQNGAILQEGQWAEVAMLRALNMAGIPTRPATDWEDHRLKVDLWSKFGDKELPIQLSTNRSSLSGSKGLDALHHGVVPAYADPSMLERAVETGNAKPVADQFVAQVGAVLRAFPNFRPIMRHA